MDKTTDTIQAQTARLEALAERRAKRRGRPRPAKPRRRSTVTAAATRTGLAASLLDKDEIVALTGLCYGTLWRWMQRGAFPRGRRAFGRTMWLRSEIDEWMAKLPPAPLKGHKQTTEQGATPSR